MERAKKLEDAQAELTQKREELDRKYPERIENKVDDALQEIMGQKIGFGSYTAGKAWIGIRNTGQGIWEAVSAPFMSDQSNVLRELAIMGEGLEEEKVYHKTDKNKNVVYDEMVFQPDLQKQIDEIKNNVLLTNDQKEQKLYTLLRENTDKFGRVPIKGGKFNVSGSSIMYGLSDLGTSLLPFVGIEAATGGIGGAGAGAKFLRTFTAAAATTFHDEYANAIAEGKPQSEAYKSAMTSTAINSLAMAGAGTPTQIRAMANGKTSAGKLIQSMSDDAIQKVLDKGTPKGLKAIGQAFKERAKELPKQFSEGLKTGAKFEAYMAGANALNGREQDAKRSLMAIAEFGILGAGLGQIGFKSPTQLQKSAGLEFGKNPEGFKAIAEAMRKDGQLDEAQYNQRIELIDRYKEAYKTLPKADAKGNELTPKQKEDYLYNAVIKNEGNRGKSNLPPKQAEKAEMTAMVADHKNDLILEPKTDKQLQSRKEQLEKQLEKKDEEGKLELTDKERKNAEAELEAINQTIKEREDTTKSEEKLPKLTEPIEGTNEYGVSIGEDVPPEVKGEPENISKPIELSTEPSTQEKQQAIEAKEVDVLGMIKESKILTPDEKKILWQQYKRGVMNENDVAKYTNVNIEDIQSGNINKWAKVVLDKIKGKEIKAEDIDFEEIVEPTEKQQTISSGEQPTPNSKGEGTGTQVQNEPITEPVEDWSKDVESTANKLKETEQKNPSLWQKIKDAAKNVLKSIKNIGKYEYEKRKSFVDDIKFEEYPNDKEGFIELWKDGKKIGEMNVHYGSDNNLGIKWVSIKPEFRGKGLSLLLYGKATEIAKEKGFNGVASGFSTHETAKTNSLYKHFNLIDLGESKGSNDGFNGRKVILHDLKDNTSEHNAISEAYHKAKADGSNPELVKAVEDLLGKPIDNTVIEDSADPEMTKMANAINDAHVEGKFGTDALDKIISQLQDTNVKEIYNKVKERIQKGILKVKDVRDRILTTKTGSEHDQAALLYDLAELKGKERHLQQEIINSTDEHERTNLQRELVDVQNQMLDNALANRYIGRAASSIFRIRQLWANKEATLFDMVDQYKASKGLKEVTPEQQAEIKKRFDIIQESKRRLEDAKDKLEQAYEENAKLKQENERLEKLKSKASSQKKADRKIKSEEAINKSKERVDKAKEALRKIINETKNVGISPKPDFYLAPKIVAEISKIAAEKVYQGVVKFEELVQSVLDEVKDILPKWENKDVIEHLLADTDKNGNVIPSKKAIDYLSAKERLELEKNDKNIRNKTKAYVNAQKEVALNMFKWDMDRRKDLMSNRPLKERVIDSILRWQRFAVLSYPSTMVKLAAVVGHQLTLKPLKWGVQYLTSLPFRNKAAIWGKPTGKSLAAYYSGLIRNFSLANLKEHFSGQDTQEILYGKPFMYDEWAAGKGLLEMPGRSHGYIKSFIKNPEFQFAHEQQMGFNLKKMEDIDAKLKNDSLSKEERENLENEYEKYDITNEDVLERINKLSLEHGKWSILMNDNKFVQKFQKFTKDNGIIGGLLKSEVPIVKIPTNYIGRYFALKYGLIRSVIGKPKWEGKENNYPGIAQLLIKGSKNLTNEQAELLSKSLTVGSFGAALFGLGYLMRNQVHKNDDGSAEIFGQHISKNLTHSPELESLFSGADMGNKHNGKPEYLRNFVENDIEVFSKNPFLQTLQYGFMANSAKAMSELVKGKDAGDTDAFTGKIVDAVGKKVADMTIPGFIKQPAQWMDTKEPGIHPMGEINKRKPTGNMMERFWQNIEMGIPVLRQNVPISKSGASGKTTKKPQKPVKKY